jgi:hypothetical protein
MGWKVNAKTSAMAWVGGFDGSGGRIGSGGDQIRGDGAVTKHFAKGDKFTETSPPCEDTLCGNVYGFGDPIPRGAGG